MSKTSRYSHKLVLGLSLLILGSLLFWNRNNSKITLVSNFENEPVKIEGFKKDKVDEAKIPKRIIVPSISINLEIKKSQIINGYWEVFENTAGWGVGSGIPGQMGNQVIFAHAKEGLFLPLRSIKLGDLVYVLTEEEWFSYKVEEVKEVLPGQIEVIAPSEDEKLTLYTCSGFRDTKRLIVVAGRN